MAKFIYLYRGEAPDLTPEQGAERTVAFGAWIQKVSAALVDTGTEGPAGDLIGYTIVEADDLTEAKALTDGLPFLAGRDGECAVDIFELLPI